MGKFKGTDTLDLCGAQNQVSESEVIDQWGNQQHKNGAIAEVGIRHLQKGQLKVKQTLKSRKRDIMI